MKKVKVIKKDEQPRRIRPEVTYKLLRDEHAKLLRRAKEIERELQKV